MQGRQHDFRSAHLHAAQQQVRSLAQALRRARPSHAGEALRRAGVLCDDRGRTVEPGSARLEVREPGRAREEARCADGGSRVPGVSAEKPRARRAPEPGVPHPEIHLLLTPVTMKVRRACVMGHPVAHSRSPMIHGYWLKTLGISGAYELKDLTVEAFPAFIANLADNGYVGGNVTVPHKEAAFRAVASRDAASEAVGAVNTLWLENGRLMGGNSDTHGFIANLDDRAPGWDVPGCRALVLGAGGAGRAAVYALKQRGAEVHVVNRTLSRAEDLAARFGVNANGFDAVPRLLREADVLVNCTSLGLAGKPPLESDLGPRKPSAVVYDVVYVPLETGLLAAARKRGHRTVDGLGMLLQQAGFGFRKWFGGNPKLTPELRAMLEADIVAKTPK